MTLKDRLTDDLRDAMRARDERRKSALRLALAAIHNAEIAAGSALDDEAVLAVLARDVKQRRESIAEFTNGNRPDLVEKEEAELAFLLPFMPEQLSRDQIAAEARRVIDQTGATGPADKGKVMGPLMAALRGKADGAEINAVVTELLAAL
jgi:uncharacterized protein YqeY